jgi:hypothetical protein
MSSGTSIDGVRLKPDATTGGGVRLQRDPEGARSVRLQADANPENGSVRLQADQSGKGAGVPSGNNAAAGFQPWHFFVLASLIAATAAVVMSRQSTPEHLVLISITIAAVGAAAAAFYRMLAPLTIRDVSALAERRSDRERAHLEREKDLVLRSIKELEFDHAMGKLSDRDFEDMGGRLRARAMMLMRQVAADGASYRELIERELNVRMTTRAGKGRLKTADVPRPPEATQVAPPSAAERECLSCGTPNDQDAVFCKRCGTRIQTAQS